MRMRLGHVITERPTDVVSEIRTVITNLTCVRESGRPEIRRKTGGKMGRLLAFALPARRSVFCRRVDYVEGCENNSANVPSVHELCLASYL